MRYVPVSYLGSPRERVGGRPTEEGHLPTRQVDVVWDPPTRLLPYSTLGEVVVPDGRLAKRRRIYKTEVQGGVLTGTRLSRINFLSRVRRRPKNT